MRVGFYDYRLDQSKLDDNVVKSLLAEILERLNPQAREGVVIDHLKFSALEQTANRNYDGLIIHATVFDDIPELYQPVLIVAGCLSKLNGLKLLHGLTPQYATFTDIESFNRFLLYCKSEVTD